MAKRDRQGRPIDRGISPAEMKRQHRTAQKSTMQKRSQPQPLPFDRQTAPRPERRAEPGETGPAGLPRENRMPPPHASKHKKKAATHIQQPPRRLTHGELRRRRRRRNLLMTLLVLLFIGIGVTLSVTVLFKVEQFQIENLDKSTPADTGIYTEDAILAGLGIPVGENMFQFSLREKEKGILTGLPYLETVEIRRKLPGTLVIRVKPAVETWAAKSDSGWLTLSSGLKIMKISEEKPEHLPSLEGLSVYAPVAGYPLELIGEIPPIQSEDSKENEKLTPEQVAERQKNAQRQAETEGRKDLEALVNLIAGLEQYGLKEECSQIELSNSNEIYFVYQGRAKVLLGTFNQLDYKLKFASYLLKNADGKGIGTSEKGTLDVSHQLEDGSLRPTWSPGDIAVQTAQEGAAVSAGGSPAEGGAGTDSDPAPETGPEAPQEPSPQTDQPEE